MSRYYFSICLETPAILANQNPSNHTHSTTLQRFIFSYSTERERYIFLESFRMGTGRKKNEACVAAEDVTEDSENEREMDTSGYEQIREQRIRENKERMHKLGLLGLSLHLKKQNEKPPSDKKRKTTLHSASLPPQRRSSRLSTLEPVNYSDFFGKVKRESSIKEEKEVEIYIPEGQTPEVYTEEQEKLLGDCETVWELFVDGYDEDGERIYDQIKGETCHQCRQKTLGQHTGCNNCELPHGQLCGDCLYMRYGENVIEANGNSKWICPVCRKICNCSRCRRANGWMPTGNIYRKVLKMGFKSVAHYLIQTYRSEKSMEGSDAKNPIAVKESQTSADTTVNRPRRRRGLRN
ncbi:hypothetical protein Lal_00016095 [Lupinus albus]|uniref:Putative Zinc-finger domain of monoamine-oxidase A repressor R1 n=1 Tax=Lupinus albus TaxID=3870 RepID=A0A6A4QHF7_LUPAL|nr:putative Zinc-finger domain of monoamine-oxidase A repressor R1 [Lupinus albus]KAF1872983.1 hypothetical protein Lal_00016095 [Lupinus albus]